MYGCLSCDPNPSGDLAYNLGMRADWKLNRRPFGLQASTQSTEPHQPGLHWSFQCLGKGVLKRYRNPKCHSQAFFLCLVAL